MSVSPVYMPTVADRLFYSSRPLLAFSFFKSLFPKKLNDEYSNI